MISTRWLKFIKEKLTGQALLRKIIGPILNSSRIIWNVVGLSETASIVYSGGSLDAEQVELSGAKVADELRGFIEPTSVVMDLGCGMGRVAKYLATSCKELHCVDISRTLLRRARKRLKDYPNVFLHRNDGRTLSSFPDNTFDFIFSVITFAHVEKEDAYSYLVEIHRILKKGAKTYLQFPNFLDEHIFCGFTNYAQNPHKRSAARIRGYTSPELELMLKEAGYSKFTLSDVGSSIFVLGKK